MRIIVFGAATMLAISGPAFAQSAPNSGATSGGDHQMGTSGARTEGRAATRDVERRSSPNGTGNALEGPTSAPDSTRNSGQ